MRLYILYSSLLLHYYLIHKPKSNMIMGLHNNNNNNSKVIMRFFVALLCVQSSFLYAHAAVKGGYWFPDSGITASAIDSTLFTHLFCAFAKLNTATNQLSISSDCSSFTQTVKQKNPSVKTLLSIGGGSAPSSDFNNMASQSSSRQAFIASSISLARSNGYAGLDLDWEQQTMASEMNNLATLLTEWRSAVNAEATNTGRPPLLLSAALAVSPRVNPSASFPAQVIARTLDWVNVMAYDFYAPDRSPSMTRSHAALRDPTGGVSGSSGINAWMSAGVPGNKLVLGFPYYGYAWKLANPNNHGLLAAANGVDTSVGFPDGGTVVYNQITAFISQKGATVVFDSSYVINYCYAGSTWIGYDDTQSIAAKVSYAKTNNLLGYFAWSVAQDNNWALSRQAVLKNKYPVLRNELGFVLKKMRHPYDAFIIKPILMGKIVVVEGKIPIQSSSIVYSVFLYIGVFNLGLSIALALIALTFQIRDTLKRQLFRQDFSLIKTMQM